MADTVDTLPVLALVRDLMFGSNISAAVKNAQLPLRIVREPAKLEGLGGRMLFVDLSLDGAIDAAAAWAKTTGKPAIGFFPHVDTDVAKRAQSAGLRAMTRGQFAAELPTLLQSPG